MFEIRKARSQVVLMEDFCGEDMFFIFLDIFFGKWWLDFKKNKVILSRLWISCGLFLSFPFSLLQQPLSFWAPQIRCDDCEEGSGNAVTEEIQIEFSARIRRLEMSWGTWCSWSDWLFGFGLMEMMRWRWKNMNGRWQYVIIIYIYNNYIIIIYTYLLHIYHRYIVI